MSEASRKLKVNELFDILQQEYIICKLRADIYLREHLKEYWEKVAEGKKKKIVDISKKNSLPSIFDHKGIEEDYRQKVFRKKGYPYFYYTSEQMKAEQEYWDLWSYYHKDTSVLVFFKEDEEPEKGKVINNHVEDRKVLVEVGGKNYLMPMDSVTRIF